MPKKSWSRQPFGEDDDNLINGMNILKLKKIMNHKVANKMAIDFNVFRALMENRIGNHMCPTKIVTMKNHFISDLVVAEILYSASTLDLETVCCFLDAHDTRFRPKKIQKSVVEQRVIRHPTQSVSAKTIRDESNLGRMVRP